MASTEFVNRHSRESGNPGKGYAPTAGFQLALRLAGMTIVVWGPGRDGSPISSKVDGPSLLPVCSFVRNHLRDLIQEGGMTNG
jgi:hypothetical protein